MKKRSSIFIMPFVCLFSRIRKFLFPLAALLFACYSCNRHDYKSSSIATIEKPNLKHDANTDTYYSLITFHADSCGNKIIVEAQCKSDAFMFTHVKPGSRFVVNYDSLSPHRFQILDYQPVLDSTKHIDSVVGSVISVNANENYFTYRFRPDSSKKAEEGTQALPPKQKKEKTIPTVGDSMFVKYVAGQPKYSVLLTDSTLFVKKINTTKKVKMKKYDFHGAHGLAFVNLIPGFGPSGGYQYAFNPHCTLGFSIMSYYGTHQNFVFGPELRLFLDQRINFYSPFVKISASYVSMQNNGTSYFNVQNVPLDTSNDAFLKMNSSNQIYKSTDRLQTWGVGIAFGMLDYGMHEAEYHRRGMEISVGIYYYNPPSQMLRNKMIGNEEFYYHGSDFQNRMIPVALGNKNDPSRGNFRNNFIDLDAKLNFTFRF